jgi:hypothetical protein
MMQLGFAEFDQASGGGWRTIGNTPGCEVAAADLLALYRAERIDAQRRGLMHHEAQLRAAAGQTEAAIVLLEDVRAMETLPEMLAYRDAELAFLRGDFAGLRAARERLLTIPAPEGFEQAAARFRENFPNFPAPTWPVNLDTIDGLIACFGRPYREAYNAPCRRTS